MPKHDYLPYFPFTKIRKEQREAVEFAINAFESGKRFVILELGTGVGKSATGITIARYMEAQGLLLCAPGSLASSCPTSCCLKNDKK